MEKYENGRRERDLASPQKENGYTPVANEILEQLVKLALNGTQLRIILIVWRYTYGFSRQKHDLSLNFIANAINCPKTQVKREIDRLISSKILIIESEASFNRTRKISFNKDYEVYRLDDSMLIRVLDTKKDTREYANQSTEQYTNQSTKKTKSKIKLKVEINFKEESQEFILANKLYGLILENNPNVKKPNLDKWAKDIDLMIRVDRRNVEDIIRVIEWCQRDSFWKSNILSTGKLREKFDQLILKAPKMLETSQTKPILVRRDITVEEVDRA